MMLALLMAITIGMAFHTAWRMNVFSGVSLLLLLPAIWLFSFGSPKKRIMNALPIIALVFVLYTGFRFDNFDHAIWVFFFLPYLGLLLEPKRHPLKYVMIFITTSVLLAQILEIRDISMFTRLSVSIVIYMVFTPPILISRFKTTLRKVRGLS